MAAKYKIDLHTHSILSPDGGITKEQYRRIFQKGTLDFIAVTDHNEINFALELNQELGGKIIVGEEIKTEQGELVGLYLKKFIQPGLKAKETIKLIKAQGGLVYLPHPFEHFRWGISWDFLPEITEAIDIIEVFNARGFFSPKRQELIKLALKENKAYAVSSDAHSFGEIGRAYTVIEKKPTRKNLTRLLSQPKTKIGKINFLYLFSPTANRIRKSFP